MILSLLVFPVLTVLAGARFWSLRRAHFESESVLKATVDALPQLIAYVNRDRTYRFNNQMYWDWFGTFPKEARGRPMKDVLGPELYGKIEPHVTAVLKGIPQRFEVDVAHPKRGMLSTVVSYSPHFDKRGRVMGFVLCVEDLTDLKRADRDRADILQRENAVLARAGAMRDEFISLVSHELLTPITGMQLQLELLNQKAESTETIRRFFKIGERQLHRLSRLVQDMLDATRLSKEGLSYQYEEMDPTEAVLEVLEEERETLRTSGSTLSHQNCAAVAGRWDRHRMQQVIANLLINAAKYGAGKPIEVEVGPAPGGEGAVMRVRDFGSGIRFEDQKRIFERFERASSSTEIPGVGLGLFIAKKIVEDHGGSIGVFSEPGKGATFVVELPSQTLNA